MRTKGAAGLLACLLVWAAPGYAASAAAAPNAASAGSDASATHVARVSLLQSGRVVTRGADRPAAAATLNAPLMPGDSFETTDPATRVEIQLDGFTDLRLGGNVRGRIVDNDARARRVEMTGGLLELAVLRGGDVASEIVTPSFTLRTHYAGDYRVLLESDGTASITPRSGQADVVTARKTMTILAGTTLVVDGSADIASATSRPAIARDSFDEFNARRDRTLLAALENDTNVPASIAGYDDLSAFGRWTKLASYGQVWVPNDQGANWAPYRDGQWSYVGNDGWTWIGSEPWAWIPYHYGRWLYSAGYGWCWYPPPFGFNPVWAPALVGFFGYGDGPQGFSNFGWVPLAPFEAYVPWYPGRYPPTRYYPPPSPPAHHHGPPQQMHPLIGAYRNARFGGASAVGADAWRDGNVTHAIPVDANRIGKIEIVKHVPVMPSTAVPKPPAPAIDLRPIGTGASPIIRPAVPGIHVSAPVVRTTTPTLPTVTPISHEPAPSRSVHSTSPHPPA